MTEEEFAQLSAAAALGALGGDDLRAYRAALAAHPDWVATVDEDARTAASLAELVDSVTPPAALRGRILALIDEAPTEASSAGDTPTSGSPWATEGDSGARGRGPRRARHARRRWFVLAASLVLLAGIGTGAVIAIQQGAEPTSVVALERIEHAPDAQQATADVTGGGTATLHWSSGVGRAVLVTGELPTLAENQTFELWYVRGTAPVSAGTFEATGSSTSTLLEAGMKPGDTIAVTIEHAGGSPTGKPTTPPILIIPTT
ncbi:anti-sigma factor [Microbacterium elymi]|uniref:Regulator of SigK n=1 Tax=Microbacterium elymi TaxID=2909587 RepID=A0ABY5NJG8_9MICO|nr:anti-sigma factor [Microbacterium elymi]UUT35315.1 anti-sigma factor [Microbacterium elymi]